MYQRRTWMILGLVLLLGCYRQVVRDIVVHVPQMKSEACSLLIQEALEPLAGVLSATPDFEQRTMTVRYDSEQLAIKNIEFVIAGTGFAANELPANPDARAKLPKECQ